MADFAQIFQLQLLYQFFTRENISWNIILRWNKGGEQINVTIYYILSSLMAKFIWLSLSWEGEFNNQLTPVLAL